MLLSNRRQKGCLRLRAHVHLGKSDAFSLDKKTSISLRLKLISLFSSDFSAQGGK